MIRTRRLIGVGVTACATLLTIPAAGHAASLTIVGDAGAAQPLTPGLAIRNMDTSVTPAFTAAEGGTTYRYSMNVTGPAGAVAIFGPPNCNLTSGGSRPVDYQGNGVYTATISTWAPREGRANSTCAGAADSTYTAQFSINASTAIGPPAEGTKLLTRNPGDFATRSYLFPVDVNPGTSISEVTYARGAVLTNGTGPIQGAPRSTSNTPNATPATADIRFIDGPGLYTLLAQAKLGSKASPFSAPLQVAVQDPYDFTSRVNFVDSRGPRYSLRGTVGSEALAGKKITMYLKRRGAKKYRKVVTSKVRGSRVVVFRFKQRQNGRYSAQFRFKGSTLVRGGSVTYRGVRFYTRRVFR